MTNAPLLSVVATSRNDNHGKNLHYRMQQFVNGFVDQCKRHDLKAELILVEWNPPDHTPPLSEALYFPKSKGPCSIRIIQVPKETHLELEHADKIPLFQMIGKNVGIRRARGKFILATNIDVLFSDSLMHFLKTKLQERQLYRVDRLDIPEKLPENVPFADVLKFCDKNILRINAKKGTILIRKKNPWKKIATYSKKLGSLSYLLMNILYKRWFSPALRKAFQTIYNFSIATAFRMLKTSCRWIANYHIDAQLVRLKKRLLWLKRKSKGGFRYFINLFFPSNHLFLHTNACGDFTLLSSQDWENLKGYPEWNIFSWHLDSVLLFQAEQHGIKEVDLPRKMSIYHIEHEAGSGFSPESAHLLFKRLDDRGIPYLSNGNLDEIIAKLKKSEEKVVYNDDDWGLARIPLREFIV